MFVGIDVSKDDLDVASEDGRLEARFSNDEKGHGELVARLRSLSPSVVLMEAAGNFRLGLTLALAMAKLPTQVTER